MRVSFLTTVSLIWLSVPAVSQSVDYNKIILPEDASNVSFEERLVQLAWRNNPISRISSLGVGQAKSEAKVARRHWSTLAGVTGNLNEFSIQRFYSTENTTSNQFFPRYNFFVQLPLSLVVQSPHVKDIGRSKVLAAEEQVNLTKLELRSRVLKLYSEYKKSEIVWLIRKQSTSDNESSYLLIEQKFTNGEIMVEDYLKAQQVKNDLKVQLAIAENEFKRSKFDLEEVIGIPLEEVK